MSLETLKTKVGLLIEKAQSAGGGTEEIETLIDQSGVLGTTDGTVTVTEKVEQLIDYANFKNIIQEALYNFEGHGNYTRLAVFRNTNVKNVSMFDFSTVMYFIDAFSGCALLEELDIDISNGSGNIGGFCLNCKSLKRVVIRNMPSKFTAAINMFGGCIALESVETLNFTGVKSFTNSSVNHCFYNCSSLKDLRVVENCIEVSISLQWSPILSAESIRNTFGGLNSEVTGQTLTLSLTAVKKAFETSKGANDGDTSAEWLALKDTKPNWTISLS